MRSSAAAITSILPATSDGISAENGVIRSSGASDSAPATAVAMSTIDPVSLWGAGSTKLNGTPVGDEPITTSFGSRTRLRQAARKVVPTAAASSARRPTAAGGPGSSGNL